MNKDYVSTLKEAALREGLDNYNVLLSQTERNRAAIERDETNLQNIIIKDIKRQLEGV